MAERINPLTNRPPSKAELRAERVLGTRQGAWVIIHIMNPLDRFLMKRSKGKYRATLGAPMLLLHTIGAKSGEPRMTPLGFVPMEADGTWLIVASNGGSERHPSWFHNLKARPDVAIDVDGVTEAVTARRLDGAEYDRAWKRAADMYDGYNTYQARTAGRTIPLFLLERRIEATN